MNGDSEHKYQFSYVTIPGVEVYLRLISSFRFFSSSFYLCLQPPSSTYYSTVPGDMTTSRMSNSTFSPTYDDPARSDEESDQYGGSTYSGGGPYARAIDSVSQSGTAKRLSK